MATKQNIFSALPQHNDSDSDDEFHKAKAKKTGEKKDTRRPDEKTQARPAQKTGTAGATGVTTKQEKEQHSRAKEVRQTKGVSSQPHPLDRQSGTGTQAYGGKPKKSGAGKGNWGKAGDEKGAPEEAGEEGEDVEEQEEEKPEGKTLQDYYQQIKFVESKPQINEAKAKITSEQLLKELGKSTKLESKRQKEVDDHRVGKKKGGLNVNHHAGISTDFADLLGFRTGFIDKEYRARGEEGGAPKKAGPRTGGKGEKEENTKEAESPTKQPAEGEQAGETAEKGTEGKEKREGGQRGGYRGGRGGDRPQGGDRKPYQKKPEPTKVNLSDESAFPKLG